MMCFRRLSNKKESDEKKGSKKHMQIKSQVLPNRRTLRNEQNASSPHCEIKRLGTTLAIVGKKGIEPVTEKSLFELKRELNREVSESRGVVRIRTNGVSRAQIGRIAGKLNDETGNQVCIRKIPSTVSRAGRIQNYEIIIRNGEIDV